MMNGSDWNVNADIQFNEQAIISFYDEDLVRNLSNNTKHFRTTLLRKMRFMMDQKKLVSLRIMQIMF